MEIQRIMIVCLVFLITWKETMNQQIPSGNDLDKRIKRNHESDQDISSKYLTNKQIKGERDKKKITPVTHRNVSPQVPVRPSNLSLGNQNTAMQIKVPQRKILIGPRNNNIKNTIYKHKPQVFYIKNHNGIDSPVKQIKVNNTLANQIAGKDTVVENEKIVDKVVDTKHEIKITPAKPEILSKNLEKPLGEALNQVKSSEKVKTKADSNPKHKSNKTNNGSVKIENTTSSIGAEAIPVSGYLNKDKPGMVPVTDNLPEIKPYGTKNNVENKIKEIMSVDFSAESDDSIINDKSVRVKSQVEKTQPKKHPFLEAIQNDLYKTCSPLDAPNTKVSEVKETNDDAETFRSQENKETSIDLDSSNNLSLENDSTENEDIVIRDNNYQELIEISRSPQVPMYSQFDTLLDNKNIGQYDNNQITYNNYSPQVKFDFSNKNQHASPYAPDDQRIEQIDGATVVSYKNYFKTPAVYVGWNNYYRNVYPSLRTNNLDYGFQRPAQPIQMMGNNLWNKRGFENKATRKGPDRIWRSWRNTEYNINPRNALKQLNNAKIYSDLENLSNAGKVKPRNAIGLDGYYRNQNISPYL